MGGMNLYYVTAWFLKKKKRGDESIVSSKGTRHVSQNRIWQNSSRGKTRLFRYTTIRDMYELLFTKWKDF